MTPEVFRAMAQAMLANPKADDAVKAQAAQMLQRPSVVQTQADLNGLDQTPLSNDVTDQVKAQAAAQLNPQQPQQPQLPSPPTPATPEQVVQTNPDESDPAIVNPEALAQASTVQRDNSLQASNKLAGMERKAAADSIAAERDIAKATQPAEDQLHQRIEQNFNDLHHAAVDVDQQAQAAIANYQSTQAEMRKMALAQPQDVWGQAGVNRVLGAAAIFFGGSGYAGNHANANLAMINSMADRAVAAQKMKFEMLSQTGQGDKTIYGMLQQKLQNQQAVSGTLKNMALESYQGMLRSIANQYADPKYKAAVEQMSAKIQGQQDATNQAVGQQYIGNSQKVLQLMGQQKALDVASHGAQLKQSRKEIEQGVAGYTGYIPLPAEHRAVAEIVSGGRGMIQGANEVEAAMHDHMSVAEYRKLLVNYSIHFAAARKFLQTGTRIEAGEQKILDSLNINPNETILTPPSKADLAGLKSKLDAVRYLITQSVDNTVDTYAHNTTKPDETDPILQPWRGRKAAIFGSDRLGIQAKNLIKELPNADGSPLAVAPVDPGAIE